MAHFPAPGNRGDTKHLLVSLVLMFSGSLRLITDLPLDVAIKGLAVLLKPSPPLLCTASDDPLGQEALLISVIEYGVELRGLDSCGWHLLQHTDCSLGGAAQFRTIPGAGVGPGLGFVIWVSRESRMAGDVAGFQFPRPHLLCWIHTGSHWSPSPW